MRRPYSISAVLTALALVITSCAPAATPTPAATTAPTTAPATAVPAPTNPPPPTATVAPTIAPTAAPAYTFEVPVKPEVAAWYIPGRFDGQEINVAVASGLFSNDAYRKVMEDLQAKFQELSGAKVNYVILPENELYDKVRLEMVANSGKYDMTESGAGGAKDFGASGFLLELPKPIDSDDIFPGDLAQYSLGDKLLGYPRVGGTNLLYWRTDLFQQAGLDPTKPPETYDQFREYALKLTTDKNGKHPGEAGFDANNIAVYGAAFKGVAGLASSWEWYNYLYAFGGKEFDQDYNITINSPEAVAALTWVVDNYRVHQIYPADTPIYDYSEFHTLFLQGQAAMEINWSYMWGLTKDPAQSKVVGQVAVGRKPGQTTHGGDIGGWSWNVLKSSKHPELAVAFAKWMASPDAILNYTRAGGGDPVRRSTVEILSPNDPDLYRAMGENQADGQSVGWLATGSSWLEVEKVVYQAIQEALIGDKTPQAALDDAAAEIKSTLEKNKFYSDVLPGLLNP